MRQTVHNNVKKLIAGLNRCDFRCLRIDSRSVVTTQVNCFMWQQKKLGRRLWFSFVLRQGHIWLPPDWKRPLWWPSHTWLRAVEADLGQENTDLASCNNILRGLLGFW